MSDFNDWNQGVIAEFRANEGRVGGSFEGAPMVLVHHVGRKSGNEYVTPLVYLPSEGNDDSIYIFASKGGAPTHPDWYGNLIGGGPGHHRGAWPHLPGHRHGTQWRGTGSRLRRAGQAHARLRRIRGEDPGHPQDPGAAAKAPVAACRLGDSGGPAGRGPPDHSTRRPASSSNGFPLEPVRVRE